MYHIWPHLCPQNSRRTRIQTKLGKNVPLFDEQSGPGTAVRPPDVPFSRLPRSSLSPTPLPLSTPAIRECSGSGKTSLNKPLKISVGPGRDLSLGAIRGVRPRPAALLRHAHRLGGPQTLPRSPSSPRRRAQRARSGPRLGPARPARLAPPSRSVNRALPSAVESESVLTRIL